MGKPIFQPLPDKPDHPRLEEDVLARWEAEATFAKLREQNAGGPTFSFIDGPVTANRFSLASFVVSSRCLTISSSSPKPARRLSLSTLR